MDIELLKKKRAERNISQDEMAEALGIKQKTYSFKETGRNEFKRDEIEIIKNILKLNSEEVYAIFFDN